MKGKYKRYSMKDKVLIVGGGGFLGKVLSSLLVKKGYDISCAGLDNPEIDNVEYIKFNLLRDNINILNQGYGLIINCTGQITNPITQCYELNSTGIVNLMKLLNDDNRFIQISSVSVFGSCENAALNSPYNPETPYSTCKALAEFLIKTNPNTNKTIIRLSNLYGEGQTKGVFHYLKRSYKGDRLLEFNNNGNMVRHYLHVEDCVNNIIRIIENKINGDFHLVGPEKYTLKELVTLFESIHKVNFKTQYSEALPYDNVQNFLNDGQFSPIYSLSLKNYLDSYITNDN